MYAYMLPNCTKRLRSIEARVLDILELAVQAVTTWVAAVSFSKDFTFEIRVLYNNLVIKLSY